MLVRFRLLCALVAIALLTTAAPTLAQPAKIRVLVQNTTPNCAWITFYRWSANTIAGSFAGAQQIKDPRSETGPLAIKPGESFEFHLPRVKAFKLRFETMNATCTSNVGGDTDTTLDDAGSMDYYYFALKGSDRKIYIDRSRQ
jgi:hypothetical protein